MYAPCATPSDTRILPFLLILSAIFALIISVNNASSNSPRYGATENAGRENGGPAKSRGVKMQDVKMTDQIAGHEIAGH